jgi:transcription elongation factor GreA
MAYFLKEDLHRVELKINETIENLKEVGNELRLATTQSSETWHDNFGFENAQQQARLLGQRISDLEQICKDAVIVEKPQTHEVVAIGHTVAVKDLETETIQTYRIGSHIAFTKDSISYASPIGKLLLGKKIGQRISGMIGTKEKSLEIIDIT